MVLLSMALCLVAVENPRESPARTIRWHLQPCSLTGAPPHDDDDDDPCSQTISK